MVIIVLSFSMKKTYKFKADNKNVNFPTRVCFGSISDEFSVTKFREVSLHRNVYDFSVDYLSIGNQT